MNRKNIFYLVFSIFTMSMAHDAVAQLEEYERGQQLRYLDLGIRQFQNGNYKDADESFREVLESVKVLPAEICYYFGANSYHLGKYKQSINWLNKYLELKGTSGQFSDESTEYLEKSRKEYRLSVNDSDEETFEPEEDVDYTVMPKVDCGPAGKVVCPICKGETVIIKRSAMSTFYKSCPYCDTHGYLSCDDYNLLIQGKLKPRDERTSQ